jgi:iron complex outermembrane recepter protein
LDKKAPLLYDAPDFSFDTRVHDPRGRLLNLTLEYTL